DEGRGRGGGREPGSVLDGPSGEDAAPAAAGYKQIVSIDVAFGDDGVDAAVEIVEVVAGIGVMDKIGEFLAVTGAAARIGVKHDVPEGGPNLLFKIEPVAVIPEGSAMNFENERIFFGGIEIGRLNDPALNLALVFRGFVPNFFDAAGHFLLKKFLIDGGEYTHRAAGGN